MFKNRFRKSPAQNVALKGHSMHIQPTTDQLKRRSLARCARLTRSIAQGAPKSFKEELKRRTLELLNHGIELPADADDIDRLARSI